MDEKIKKLWARVKGWYAGITLAACARIFGWFWEKAGDFDLAQTVLRWFGMDISKVATFLLSPVFSLLMAGIGIFDMVYLEKPDFKTKHPASQLVGVSIFVAFASLIGGSLVFKQLLNTQTFAEVTHFYIAGHEQRHLTDTQKTVLIESCEHDGLAVSIPFYISSSTDNDSIRLASDIYSEFSACGKDGMTWINPADQIPGQQGIMVELVNPKAPSPQAMAIMKDLKDAKIPFRVWQWPDRGSSWPPSPDFIIYVTPDTPAPP